MLHRLPPITVALLSACSGPPQPAGDVRALPYDVWGGGQLVLTLTDGPLTATIHTDGATTPCLSDPQCEAPELRAGHPSGATPAPGAAPAWWSVHGYGIVPGAEHDVPCAAGRDLWIRATFSEGVDGRGRQHALTATPLAADGKPGPETVLQATGDARYATPGAFGRAVALRATVTLAGCDGALQAPQGVAMAWTAEPSVHAGVGRVALP